jgi:hypothetical protein
MAASMTTLKLSFRKLVIFFKKINLHKADQIMSNQHKKPNLSALKKLPDNVVTSATDIVNQVTDYLKVAQIETTKRTDIVAKRDCALAAIQAQRDVLMRAIDLTFQERASVLQGQLNALEHAVKNGNADIVSMSLQSMVHVIETSPFKSIAEVRQFLSSNDSVLRLE